MEHIADFFKRKWGFCRKTDNSFARLDSNGGSAYVRENDW